MAQYDGNILTLQRKERMDDRIRYRFIPVDDSPVAASLAGFSPAHRSAGDDRGRGMSGIGSRGACDWNVCAFVLIVLTCFRRSAIHVVIHIAVGLIGGSQPKAGVERVFECIGSVQEKPASGVAGIGCCMDSTMRIDVGIGIDEKNIDKIRLGGGTLHVCDITCYRHSWFTP